MSDKKRRWLLGAAGTALAATAGCVEVNTGGDGEGGGGDTPADTSTESGSTPTATETPESAVDQFEDLDTPTPEPDTPTPEPEPEGVAIADETLRVHEDEYQVYQFSVEEGTYIAYRFTVRQGPNIDVYVMPYSEFQQYKAGNRFRYNIATAASAGGQNKGTLSSGRFVLLVDNTSAGSAAPPSNFDDDVAEVEIAAGYQPPS